MTARARRERLAELDALTDQIQPWHVVDSSHRARRIRRWRSTEQKGITTP